MGDHWLLNGTKVFISGGGIADVYVIMAMTDKTKGTKGISSFIVEKGTPGFTIGKKENKMGIRASLAAELVFEDCKIPKENLLGEIGKGFKVAMTSVRCGKTRYSCTSLGDCPRSL
jgi:butyryl-CoA dehydrogenase